MTPERYQRIGQLFDAALELAPEQRAAFLAQACSADMALRAEVEKLLANHVESAEFLSRPAIGVAATLLAQNQPVPAGASASGKQISYYKILSGSVSERSAERWHGCRWLVVRPASYSKTSNTRPGRPMVRNSLSFVKSAKKYPIGNVLYEISGMLTDPRFSPDGTRIAFFDHPKKLDDKGAVSVVDLKGQKTMLSDGYWSERGLAWSPDGKEVMFSASLSGGDFVIFAVTLAGVRRIAEQAPGGLMLQAVAPDANSGRWLVNRLDYRYTAMVHTPGVPPNTTEDIHLSWLRTSKSKALSQDGRMVLFTEDSSG